MLLAVASLHILVSASDEAVPAGLHPGACEQEAGGSVSMLQTRAQERQRRARRLVSAATAAASAVLAGRAANTTLLTTESNTVRIGANLTLPLAENVPVGGAASAAATGLGHLDFSLMQTLELIHKGPAMLQTAVRNASGTSLFLVILLMALTAGSVLFIVQQGKFEVQNKAFQDRLLAPLCPALVVQDAQPLVCRVQCKLWHDRQHLSFVIVDPGGAGVARAVVNEVRSARGCVSLEPLGGGAPMASAATEGIYVPNVLSLSMPIFQGPPPPEPPSAPTAMLPPPPAARPGSSRADLARQRQQTLLQTEREKGCRGAYAVLERTNGKEYMLTRMDRELLTFRAGRLGFRGHTVGVFSKKGRKVAGAEPMEEPETAEGEEAPHTSYEVTIAPYVDAGLVLLCLLAIDKCERPPEAPAPRCQDRCFETITAGYQRGQRAMTTEVPNPAVNPAPALM